ncbi:hypothetical protein [Roseibium aggregatum]|uniref:hypothetical protein n=1 Tax=Roseibium aggregatum TaxID=187304 RepID=UPI0025AD5E1B|nr:hypothetical protein [Roseibium aggregatum]WJS05208.1 hypothetical protein QUB73_13265 [Roseibium aggregatum]
MAKDPILDLSTLIDRPFININGARYELFTADELSIADSHWFSAKGAEIEKLASGDDTEAMDEAVSELAARCLVDCPEEVFIGLSGTQKLAITEVFTRLLLQRKARQAGAIAKMMLDNQKKTPTGAKPSQGSSVSSAALRTGGSSKPQQHS